MSVNSDFSALNSLRPHDARFGEVVAIDLYVSFVDPHAPREFVGNTKRKSIHCPPSTNAYWNFVNLRTRLTEWFTLNGVSRRDRSQLVRLLNLGVRHIHLHEMEATYSKKKVSYQYYTFVLKPVYLGLWSLEIRVQGAEESVIITLV
jgi:hypothetical protein